MPSVLGAKIRELRKTKGYTLEQLAELAGSSKSYIWELENREAPRPSGEKLSKIAEVLGVPTEYLLSEAVSPPEEIKKDIRVLYRKFKKLSEGDQDKIRKIIDAWGKDD